MNDYRWRKAEIERLHRRSAVGSLEVGKIIDFRTKEYVWHPAVVRRMRVDPSTKKITVLLTLQVVSPERASMRGRRSARRQSSHRVSRNLD